MTFIFINKQVFSFVRYIFIIIFITIVWDSLKPGMRLTWEI